LKISKRRKKRFYAVEGREEKTLTAKRDEKKKKRQPEEGEKEKTVCEKRGDGCARGQKKVSLFNPKKRLPST